MYRTLKVRFFLSNFWGAVQNAKSGQGIGTEFFKRLDFWVQENKIVRLELSVETNNDVAIHLYQKNDFEVEGRKTKTMLVKGQYRDEYVMAKINEIF